MPLNAIRGNEVDHIVSVEQMAGLIDRLTREKSSRLKIRVTNRRDHVETGIIDHKIPTDGPGNPPEAVQKADPDLK